VKALVIEDERVFLIKERRADGSVFWTLPGGGLRNGESPSDGLRREIAEEIECGVGVGDPITTCRYPHGSDPTTVTHYLVFDCELHGRPDPNRTEGVVDAARFDPSRLPVHTLSPFVDVVQASHGDGSS